MADWPHSPPHRNFAPGSYMVTAGTLYKQYLFVTPEKLDMLQDTILTVFAQFNWTVQAWTVLANHYHLVAFNNSDPENLEEAIAKIHRITAHNLNRIDNTPGRRVWFRFWETKLDYRNSYFVRLHYVHENVVHHRVVERAVDYAWCSAAWFEQKADMAFKNMVQSFKFDRSNIYDDFD